tara:strand:- start:63 stop:326 length:264 start_codon:yes stop_codon:yes gene_type:complete
MKKGVLAFEVLVKAILVIAVLVILLFMYNSFFGQQKKVGDDQISGLTSDFDSDGIKDILDKCPCDPGEAPKCKTDANTCRDDIKNAK